jgi:hypothetical protein
MSKHSKLNLVEVLNDMYNTKHEKLQNNAESIIKAAKEVDNGGLVLLGHSPCLITNLSLDGRGRAQRSIRVPDLTGQEKTNFRPWHIVWIRTNGPAPNSLQYSHRCNQENCVESTHGVWETDITNKSRWSCRVCSHLILPDSRIIRICPHQPCCLVPIILKTWDDPRFVQAPVQ